MDREAVKERRLPDVKDANLSFLAAAEQSLPSQRVAQGSSSTFMASKLWREEIEGLKLPSLSLYMTYL